MSKILKCSGAAIMHRIIDEITVGKREFRARVNGCFDRITVMHTITMYEIKSVLSLRRVKARRGAGNGNTYKMAKRSEVCHRELVT
jgi:hypothetical protein